MASAEQKVLMKKWYDHTGFQFLEAGEVRADNHAGFVDAWRRNVKWLEDHAYYSDRIIDEYKIKHGV